MEALIDVVKPTPGSFPGSGPAPIRRASSPPRPVIRLGDARAVAHGVSLLQRLWGEAFDRRIDLLAAAIHDAADLEPAT